MVAAVAGGFISQAVCPALFLLKQRVETPEGNLQQTFIWTQGQTNRFWWSVGKGYSLWDKRTVLVTIDFPFSTKMKLFNNMIILYKVTQIVSNTALQIP